MKKNSIFAVACLLTSLIVIMSACGSSTDSGASEDSSLTDQSQTNNASNSTEDDTTSETKDTSKDPQNDDLTDNGQVHIPYLTQQFQFLHLPEAIWKSV